MSQAFLLVKVLHIVPSLSPKRGGASKAAIDMVVALRMIGIDVEIACTNDDGPTELDVPLGELNEYAGVPVRFFKRFSPRGKNRFSSAVREFAYSRSFRKWLKKNIDSYDVLHVHALFSFTSSYAMYLARKRNVKYIAHPIGSLENWSLKQSARRKKAFLALIDGQNLKRAAYVHFTAESERDQALAVIRNINPLVIPLGLELPVLNPDSRQQVCSRYALPQDSIILLFLGRLHEKKGLELLLQALANIPDPRLRLLVAGDGDPGYRQSLITEVKRLGVEESTAFLGHIDGQEKNDLIQGADLFSLTSYSENFGIAALEAMAHGTAVLLSKDVALAAAVNKYKMGATCETNILSIEHSLTELIQSLDDLDKQGQRGREYVSQHHHWPSLAEKLARAYTDIAVN